MIEYRSLESVRLAEIVACFNEAFSEYEVPIDMNESIMSTNFAANGVVPTVSIGAFDGSRLVGFVLNGSREIDGIRTGYDAGTGVVPSRQGHGVATKLVARSLERLRATGHRRYLLEVLENNSGAIKVYKNHGFSVKQTYNCFSISCSSLVAPINPTVHAVPAAEGPLDASAESDLAAYVRYTPSWQNSGEALRAIRSSVRVIRVRTAAGGIGIIALNGENGSLRQLGWSGADDHAGEEVLRVTAATIGAQELRFVNIPDGAVDTNLLLTRLGAKRFVRQFQMVREL